VIETNLAGEVVDGFQNTDDCACGDGSDYGGGRGIYGEDGARDKNGTR